MSWDDGTGCVGKGFLAGFFTLDGVADRGPLGDAVGIRMPGMLLMSIGAVLFDAGALCALAASGSTNHSTASSAERFT
ncbi:hypothetical protein RKE25_22535 (plasmid) [Dyella sp. BiH032]|uniref:hypothetical protein n=1 Tax=Dyella sp. BiH032 TaxID=3075430 RepID=UPI00289317DB|nr:hypothetical protein [Dyella sp. BiH032]WNL48511.1 hypothetical protein RKE25_22535 [Dyella sp. BiH032]